MKQILIVFVFGVLAVAANAQDVDGFWKSTKAGAELIIEIRDGKAVIKSVQDTKIPKQLLDGFMYEDIRSAGKNIWKARRNAWKYQGMGGENAESGHWEPAEELTLTLSEDGNMLTASGHWTYVRVVQEDDGFIEQTKKLIKSIIIDESKPAKPSSTASSGVRG